MTRSHVVSPSSEIEREAIRREDDEVKLEELNKEIATLREEEAGDKAKWMREQELINRIQQCKIEVEQLKIEADSAERSGDYGRVAEIRYGRLKEKEAEIASIQQELTEAQGDSALIREEVTAEDIADIVSRWTGSPVGRCSRASVRSSCISRKSCTSVSSGQEQAIRAVR